MNSKWSKTDKWLLILQIISIIVSVIISVIPEEKLSDSVKVSIICAFIGIPIIIIQISLTVGNTHIEDTISKVDTNVLSQTKKTDDIAQSLNDGIDKIYQETKQIDSLYQIYSSPNERIRRFADRRIKEMIETLTRANQVGTSGLLEVREYYAELDFLADKLENDDANECSVWAMTGFAPDEWSATGGYEKAWTERLKNLSERNIKTMRLCLLNNDIIHRIKDTNFKPRSKKSKNMPIDGFISLLKQYYRTESDNCTHYVVLANEFPDLEKIKGFFGIVLSNGEKHVIEGEAVNLENGLTGNVLFKVEDIEKIYSDFKRACQPNREIIKYINSTASESFKNYLKQEKILL